MSPSSGSLSLQKTIMEWTGKPIGLQETTKENHFTHSDIVFLSSEPYTPLYPPLSRLLLTNVVFNLFQEIGVRGGYANFP